MFPRSMWKRQEIKKKGCKSVMIVVLLCDDIRDLPHGRYSGKCIFHDDAKAGSPDHRNVILCVACGDGIPGRHAKIPGKP